MDKIDISKRLRVLRKENNYSQKMVADGIKVTRGTYGAYEEERSTPTLPTLIALAKFYGFETIEELLGTTLSKKPGELIRKYRAATAEQRKIVDFILSGK